jgi:hypothetical protein
MYTGTEVLGDCTTHFCNAQGQSDKATDPNDAPMASEPCVIGICDNGIPQTASAPPGTACQVNGAAGTCAPFSICLALAPCGGNPVPCCCQLETQTCYSAPAHCCNGIQDQGETGIDCGDTDCGLCP